MLVICTKRGSDYNYLFEPSVLGLLWLLNLHQTRSQENRSLRWLQLALPVAVFAFGVVVAGNAFVAATNWSNQSKARQSLTPRQRLTISEARPEWDQLRRSLIGMPAPVLVTDRCYNLPWIQSQPPHFVVAYTYSLDRKDGRSYEGGGLAGLIDAGYFKTIVTPVALSTNAHMTVAAIATRLQIDGQTLNNYELHHSDRHFEYYVIRSDKSEKQISSR
jgi:hypothetical protein